MAAITCPGEVFTGAAGEAVCRDAVGNVEPWVIEQPFAVDFDAAVQPFMVGFLLMASCWALGKGVALVISLVKN